MKRIFFINICFSIGHLLWGQTSEVQFSDISKDQNKAVVISLECELAPSRILATANWLRITDIWSVEGLLRFFHSVPKDAVVSDEEQATIYYDADGDGILNPDNDCTLVEVTYRECPLLDPPLEVVPGPVRPRLKVIRNRAINEEQVFDLTQRTFSETLDRGFFPYTLSELTGLRVLDLACGPGRMVKDMRSESIEAFGMDLALDVSPLVLRPTPNYLAQGDLMCEIQFETEAPEFDLIYEVFGPFAYNVFGDYYFEQIWNRINTRLAPNGEVIVGPFPLDERVLFEQRLSMIGGWRSIRTELPPGLTGFSKTTWRLSIRRE